MKILNSHNLPKPLIDAVSYDTYSKGNSDYSCTGLLRPSHMVRLEKEHADDLEVDAVDLLYRLTGQAAHVVLERAALANPDYFVERRFYTDIELLDKTYCISGQLDLYDPKTKTLYDWKNTSVWKEIMGDKDDWIKQGNINKFILEKNGIQVDKIIYIAFYRDWKKKDSFRDDYPKIPVGTYDFGELWPETKTLKFIQERIMSHLSNSHECCSAEERWDRPATYAVKKVGAARATKVFDFQSDAEIFIKGKSGYEIEHRPAEYIRCRDYCQVKKWCLFAQQNKIQ